MSYKKNNPTSASGAIEGADNTLGNKESIAFSTCSVNLQPALQNLMSEMHNLTHGILTLQIHFREGSPYRYTVSRETSFLCGKGE